MNNLLPRATGWVLDKWKVVYVITPKLMSTSMLWMMAGLQNEDPARYVAQSRAPQVTRALAVHDPAIWQQWFKPLHLLPADVIEQVTSEDGWFRLGWTRHPVDRLWSAWQSKLLLREPLFVEQYATAQWFPRTPKELPEGAAALGAIAEDFESFVAALAQDPQLLTADPHWAPQSYLLRPGLFPYSEIGRIEAAAVTLGRLECHLQAQGWRGTLDLKRLNATLLPRALIRDATLLRLIEKIYTDDMIAFGYEPANVGHPPSADASAVAVQALAELVERHERISDLHRMLAPGAPGIDLGGAASPARRRRIDLVGRELTNRWTLLHPNQWVRTDPQGLRLHPNEPGAPPPTLTLRDGIVPGEYRFDAELVVFDERCQQHTITVCIRGPHSAQRFSTKVAGGMASPVAWHVPAISVAERSDIEIVVALDDDAADASYSATQLVGALTVRDQALFEAGEAAKAPPLSFAEMSAVGGVSYIEQTRSADAVWGFSHVPKTAGSTLNAALEAHRAPYYYIYARPGATSSVSFKELEWEAVRKFADSQKSAPADTRCRSFSGHLRRPHIDFIQAELPGTRFFTVLREPVARVVSDYRYCMTPNFWGHEKFAAEFPTITDYIRDPINQNRMSKYLAAKCDTAEMVIDSVLHGFEFIGIMELYDVSMSMIFQLMGLTHIPTQRVNETISTDRNAIELSDAVREEILARNAIDDALYRAVREILEPQCEAWRRHFATLSQPDTGPAR